MTVTVIVSGLPDHIPLTDIAYQFDKYLNTDEVGTFRLREIWDETDRHILALDFESGFDAMHVQMKLDGIRLTLNNDREYKIKCKISNDKMHTPRAPIEYEDTFMKSISKYESSSNSLYSSNDYKMRKECSSLDTYLTLLQKKKKVVDAERELLKAKKKLKREHETEGTDSEDENSSNDIKYSKVSKSRDYRKRKSSSRESPPSTSKRDLVPVSRRSSTKRTRSRSRSRSRRSSIKSPSRDTNVYTSSKSYYDRVSDSTSKTVYRSASTFRRSRSSSRKRSRSPWFKKSSRYDRSPPSFRKSPSTSRSSYYVTQSSSRRSYKRESPCYYRTPRNERTSMLSSSIKYYKDDEYSERNDEKDGDLIRDVAVQRILIEMDDLLQNEKKSLSENEISMVTNVFRDHVANGFRKLSMNIHRNMSIKEAVDVYRRYHSKDEDKKFVLKMILELKSFDTKNAINTNIVCETVDLTEANDVWDDIEEVLDDIPIEMLQCNKGIITSTDQCSDDNVTDKAHEEIGMKMLDNEIHDQQVIEPKEKLVPENPTFIIPIKKLMRKMKAHLSKFSSDSDCKDLHDITKNILRERISNILKGKGYMKTAQIIELYRSVHPEQDDEMFLKDIVDNIKNGKYHEATLKEEVTQ